MPGCISGEGLESKLLVESPRSGNVIDGKLIENAPSSMFAPSEM
jgi:hypothetical protein